ncbi:MAG: DUF2075 domain-containing protein [Firmicutes bacterium]|nr:DUF2075 domain-containing protein [Bacillota bacterium]
MKPTNILSAYQGINAINNAGIRTAKEIKETLKLSKSEANVLEQFCITLKSHQHSFEIFDGYYVGYSIKQISKEFDLLRFSEDLVINIELKSQLDEKVKLQKITAQMKQNHYYLKFLNRSVFIYTYVENDALYKYDADNDQPQAISIDELITNLINQSVDLEVNPDKLFVPSNYLISPFNKLKEFIDDEYFLTDNQQNIKKEVVTSVQQNKHKIFCILANAGTGKTLLVYDIAKNIMSYGHYPLIIHCGKLNNGHYELINSYNWNLHPINKVHNNSIETLLNMNISMVLIDESQRIRQHQLEMIINKSKEFKTPIVFSYDKKQYLKTGEAKDIYEYITARHPDIAVYKKTLTNKIRTNKEMASFIINLTDIGKSNNFLNYESITIEYFEELDDIKTYIQYLEQCRGWKPITYTNSQYTHEPLDNLASISHTKAHDVIGQEFDKVVFVMDDNFSYNEKGRLTARKNYYSAEGMLYQIVTRVVSQLKIIVLNNPRLYYRLLQIKSLDKS